MTQKQNVRPTIPTPRPQTATDWQIGAEGKTLSPAKPAQVPTKPIANPTNQDKGSK